MLTVAGGVVLGVIALGVLGVFLALLTEPEGREFVAKVLSWVTVAVFALWLVLK